MDDDASVDSVTQLADVFVDAAPVQLQVSTLQGRCYQLLDEDEDEAATAIESRPSSIVSTGDVGGLVAPPPPPSPPPLLSLRSERFAHPPS